MHENVPAGGALGHSSGDSRRHRSAAIDATAAPLVTLVPVPLADLVLDPGDELPGGPESAAPGDTERGQETGMGDEHDATSAFVRAFAPRRAYRRLCGHGLNGIQSRIEKEPHSLSGRILARPDDASSTTAQQYVVIDGAWHAAALRRIIEDGPLEGGPVGADVTALADGVPVKVVAVDTDPAVVLALLVDPVQHHRDAWVCGQRNRLLNELRSSGVRHSHDAVAEALGHDRHALRRFHAYRALQQMMHDHSLSASEAAELYPLFHAAVGRPPLRTWLDWDEPMAQFLDDRALDRFHRLLAPSLGDAGARLPAEARTVDDIVHLCDVVSDPDALAILMADGGTLQAAFDHLNAGLFHHMATQVTEAIDVMQWDRRRFDRRRS